MGVDPGIHAHSDISDYDLFGEIKKEEEEERKKASKKSNRHSSHGRLYSENSKGQGQESEDVKGRTQSLVHHGQGRQGQVDHGADIETPIRDQHMEKTSHMPVDAQVS